MVRRGLCRPRKYSIATPESEKYLRLEMCLVAVTIDLSSDSPHLSVQPVYVCVYMLCVDFRNVSVFTQRFLKITGFCAFPAVCVPQF